MGASHPGYLSVLGCALSCLCLSALAPPALSALLAPPCLSVPLRARPSFGDRLCSCQPLLSFACVLSTISPPPLRVPIPFPPSPPLSLGALGIASLYSGCQLACAGLLRFCIMTDQRYFSLPLQKRLRFSSVPLQKRCPRL